MITLTEEEIIRLLDEVPPERRLHARGALSGTPGQLAVLIRGLTGEPADWQAYLGASYMAGFAAGHRPPGEVVELHRELEGHRLRDDVLAAAAVRLPADLAAIAAEVGATDAAGFLRKAMTLQRPGDVAAMLTAMGNRPGLRGEAIRHLCLSEPPVKAAIVALHLRGETDAEAAATAMSEIGAIMAWEAAAAGFAVFLTLLNAFGLPDGVRELVATVVAPSEPEPPGEGTAEPVPPEEPRDIVNRLAELVNCLLLQGQDDLAGRVVNDTLDAFTGAERRYRLYALVFIFREHGMIDTARKVANAVAASAEEDNVTMVLQFCGEDPGSAAALLEIILAVPQDSLMDTAVNIAKKIEPDNDRETIFKAVADWPHEYHPRFYKGLRGTSTDYADKFRDAVAARAGRRKDGEDIGHTVIWLLKDENGRRRWNHAVRVLREVTSAGGEDRETGPNRLADLICTLRDKDGWWARGPRRELRDEVAILLSEHYTLADMLALIEAAENRCLPAIVRMAPDWLTHGHRSNHEICGLFSALEKAGASGNERWAAANWTARSFNRPDIGIHPYDALANAGLIVEREGWLRALHPQIRVPRRPHRPDPDPRPPGLPGGAAG